MNQADTRRFFQSIDLFNTLEPIGSIYERNYIPKNSLGGRASKKSKIIITLDGEKF